MLEEYKESSTTRPAGVTEQPPIPSNCLIQVISLNMLERERDEDMIDSAMVLKNSDALSNLKDKLQHFSASEQKEMTYSLCYSL